MIIIRIIIHLYGNGLLINNRIIIHLYGNGLLVTNRTIHLYWNGHLRPYCYTLRPQCTHCYYCRILHMCMLTLSTNAEVMGHTAIVILCRCDFGYIVILCRIMGHTAMVYSRKILHLYGCILLQPYCDKPLHYPCMPAGYWDILRSIQYCTCYSLYSDSLYMSLVRLGICTLATCRNVPRRR